MKKMSSVPFSQTIPIYRNSLRDASRKLEYLIDDTHLGHLGHLASRRLLIVSRTRVGDSH